jgi:hypothetical protein
VVNVGDNTIQPLKNSLEPVQSKSVSPLKEKSELPQSSRTSETKPGKDSTYFSDELHEPRHKHSNISGFKGQINEIRENLGVMSSGDDVSGDLATIALAAQLEQSGLPGGGPNDKSGMGLTPGIINTGVISSSGTISGTETGLQSGGVFSSRRNPTEAHQPGGGTAIPEMVKLMVDYAHAVKSGHNINNNTDEMVLKILNDAGKTDSVKTLLEAK